MLWLALVSMYMRHEHRNFFGNPVQVWSLTQHSTLRYIPIESIKSRVVAAKMQIELPSGLQETVFVATPIEHRN